MSYRARSFQYLLLAAAVAAPQGRGDEDDHDRMQGTWQIVSAEFSGRAVASVVGGVHTVVDNRIIRPNLRTREYRFEFDPSESPKTIDLTADRLGDASLKGIYAITNDTLRICYSYDPGLPRPTQFATEPGVRAYLYEYKRVVGQPAQIMAQASQRQPPPAPNGNPFVSSVTGYPNWSAFTGVKWNKDRPIVRVEGSWYELYSFHGVTVADIVKECEKNGWPMRERVTEDLVQIIRLMGLKIDKTTDLELIDDQGEVVTMKDVAMTQENLREIMTGGAASSNPFLSSVPGYPKWSAFSGIKWEHDKPIVEVKDQWYELLSFHGIPTRVILDECEKNRWPRMRVEEDLVQIVRLMGHEIDKTTDLVLKDAGGKVVTMKNVEMTETNLRRATRRSPGLQNLNREDLLYDLQFFQTALESQFSYLKANKFNYTAAIRAIADANPDGMPGSQLAQDLQEVMAMFIDGHAGVRESMPMSPDGYLPFLIEPSGNRFVAVRPDRSSLLDPDLPYISSIDDVPIKRWIEETQRYIAKGSPQMVRDRGLRLMRSIEHSRSRLGLPSGGQLNVELVSRACDQRRTKRFDLAANPASYGTWPPVQSPQVLDGGIGYMRLERLDSNATALIRVWMPRFRNTKALIIDIRGNGGGIRTPILELAGYLLRKEDVPRIGNVAKYRLAEQFPEDHLSAARYVYPATSKQFDVRERAAVREFAITFTPQWEPPANEFSDWHYLVLSKRKDDSRFDYRGRVAILMDEGCFSATDIFLGAFKGWPNVTLIGQPSGGGSARTVSFRLPRSGIGIRCASMASFQPNGKLYDTNGITPDISVVRPPEYYVLGNADAILERAMEALTDQR